MDRSISNATACRDGGQPADERLVIIIDPDNAFAARSAESLRRMGCSVLIQEQPRDLPIEVSNHRGQVTIIMELCPDGVPRPQVLSQLRSRFPKARILVVTAYPSSEAAVLSVRLGADHYMAKPVSGSELVTKLDLNEGSLDSCALPSLARIEWEYINRVLSLTNGNISAAARILAMGRSTLQRKLRQYPPLR